MILRKNPYGNNLINKLSDEYYVSYNSNPSPLLGNNGPETAFKTPDGFYIVEGDLRRQLKKVNTIQEAFGLFSKYEEGMWSAINQEELNNLKNNYNALK